MILVFRRQKIGVFDRERSPQSEGDQSWLSWLRPKSANRAARVRMRRVAVDADGGAVAEHRRAIDDGIGRRRVFPLNREAIIKIIARLAPCHGRRRASIAGAASGRALNDRIVLAHACIEQRFRSVLLAQAWCRGRSDNGPSPDRRMNIAALEKRIAEGQNHSLGCLVGRHEIGVVRICPCSLQNHGTQRFLRVKKPYILHGRIAMPSPQRWMAGRDNLPFRSDRRSGNANASKASVRCRLAVSFGEQAVGGVLRARNLVICRSMRRR